MKYSVALTFWNRFGLSEDKHALIQPLNECVVVQLVVEYTSLGHTGACLTHGSMGCQRKHRKLLPTPHAVHMGAELVTNAPHFDIYLTYRHTFVTELNAWAPEYTRFVIMLQRVASFVIKSHPSQICWRAERIAATCRLTTKCGCFSPCQFHRL